MSLQNKNLYDPIAYMIKQMTKKSLSGYSKPSSSAQFSETEPYDLIRENGQLKQVVGTTYVIELFYLPNKFLDKVVGTTNLGYSVQVSLTYANGLLVHVETVDLSAAPDEGLGGGTNNLDNPFILN